jgi:hypothetical protein
MATRILVLCRGGRVRSVAVRKWLQDESDIDCDVLAAGLAKNSRETIEMLVAWSDVVLVCAAHLLAEFSWLDSPKVWVVEIGSDIWGAENHPDLRRRVREKMERLSEVLNECREGTAAGISGVV